MKLIMAAAFVLVGCSSEPRDCSLDPVEQDFVAGATLDDCGTLDNYTYSPGSADTAAFQAAQACVLDHVQQHRAFRVTWTRDGVDTAQHNSYVGLMHDGAWTLASFQQFTGATVVDQPTERDACADLTAVSPCSTMTTDLCISCVGRTTADQCMP